MLCSMTVAQQTWTDHFQVDKKNLVSTGKNPYFILEVGHRLELAGGDNSLVISVLPDTEMVDGVETRVVEERESEGGNVVEVSRNFYAIDKMTHDLYYFGEDVDMYENGKVVSHDGAWRSGKNGAKFGLMMPGKIKVGRASYEEVAPKIAMDRAKIIAKDHVLVTKAGTFKNCVKTEETTPLEPRSKEYKVYAPGIGLIQDADLKLVKVSHMKAAK
jgi:hypothetical protein